VTRLSAKDRLNLRTGIGTTEHTEQHESQARTESEGQSNSLGAKLSFVSGFVWFVYFVVNQLS
jgi:hypothetical protein